MERKTKLVNQSRTTMTEMIMPNDTNPLGSLMGGVLMRWMDIAAGICGGKHCEAHVVTASVDHVSFKHPIKLGEIITLEACVTRAFNTSVEVYVEVFVNNFEGKPRVKSNHAYFTMVALDPDSKTPRPAPLVAPETDAEFRLYEGANRRREMRLVLSGSMPIEDAVDIKSLFKG